MKETDLKVSFLTLSAWYFYDFFSALSTVYVFQESSSTLMLYKRFSFRGVQGVLEGAAYRYHNTKRTHGEESFRQVHMKKQGQKVEVVFDLHP